MVLFDIECDVVDLAVVVIDFEFGVAVELVSVAEVGFQVKVHLGRNLRNLLLPVVVCCYSEKRKLMVTD